MQVSVVSDNTTNNQLQCSTYVAREAMTLSRNTLYILTSCEFDEHSQILLLEQHERKCIVRAFKAFSTLILAITESNEQECTTICARNAQMDSMQLPQPDNSVSVITVWPFAEQKELINSDNAISVKADISSSVRDRVEEYISTMREQVKKRHTNVFARKCINASNVGKRHEQKMLSAITDNFAKGKDVHRKKHRNCEHDCHRKEPYPEKEHIDFSFLWSEDNIDHTDSNVNCNNDSGDNTYSQTSIYESYANKCNSVYEDKLQNNVCNKTTIKTLNVNNDNAKKRMEPNKKTEVEIFSNGGSSTSTQEDVRWNIYTSAEKTQHNTHYSSNAILTTYDNNDNTISFTPHKVNKTLYKEDMEKLVDESITSSNPVIKMQQSKNNVTVTKLSNDILSGKNEIPEHKAGPSSSSSSHSVSTVRMPHVDHNTITDRWASQLQFDRFWQLYDNIFAKV